MLLKCAEMYQKVQKFLWKNLPYGLQFTPQRHYCGLVL